MLFFNLDFKCFSLCYLNNFLQDYFTVYFVKVFSVCFNFCKLYHRQFKIEWGVIDSMTLWLNNKIIRRMFKSGLLLYLKQDVWVKKRFNRPFFLSFAIFLLFIQAVIVDEKSKSHFILSRHLIVTFEFFIGNFLCFILLNNSLLYLNSRLLTKCVKPSWSYFLIL